MLDIIAIVTAATTALEDLNVLPYVFAGGVVALIGMLIRSAKKATK